MPARVGRRPRRWTPQAGPVGRRGTSPANGRGVRRCRRSCWSAPSGATRARARRPTCWAATSTTSSSSTAATTPATPSSSTARSTRCTCSRRASSRPTLHPGHRQRRRHRPRGALPGDRRARGARRRHVQAVVSANAHLIAPYNRTLDKVTERFLGVAADRHDRARHRPDLRRQDVAHRHPRPGPVRRGDPAPEGRGGARPEEPGARQDLQPPRGLGRRGRRASCSRTPTGCAHGRRHRLRARGGARRRQERPARGGPGHPARRRPRHVPVRHVVQRDGGRGLHRVRHPADPGRLG